MTVPHEKMIYNRLGNTGLKVSALSFGSWVTFDNQLDTSLATECMAAAREAGCNFFDNAEVYAGGKSETIMGAALAELGWPRWSYVVSTKFYWGINGEIPNVHYTLNRKYLMQAIEGSLERLGLDFVDLIYCHRPDPHTPLEETVWAMSDIITKGQAHYWGTSEWSAQEIQAAIDIAKRHNLHAPVTEQSQYNLIERDRVEKEYDRLHKETGYGNTIWSPLASGLLTGKYVNGIPEGSRGALDGYDWLKEHLNDREAIDRIEKLRPIAKRLDASMAQLALAWATLHPMVSTVITGASKVSQVRENFEAIELVETITPEIKAEIEAALS